MKRNKFWLVPFFIWFMFVQKHISSTANPEIRRLVQLLQKARERKKSGLFVLEGLREFQLALKGGYAVETVFYCPEIISISQLNAFFDTENYNLISISSEVYKHLAYREKTEGILVLLHAKNHSLEHFKITAKNPLLLVAESPEKPGNIGALLRTADAAGLDGVLIADASGDLYNPNVIRSSVGCLFTVPVATVSSNEAIAWLKQQHISILAASLAGAVRYDTVEFKLPTAIVVGTEATGLTALWTDAADAAIKIPMNGAIDSMNVSVAAAILIFEACRQRKFEVNKGNI